MIYKIYAVEKNIRFHLSNLFPRQGVIYHVKVMRLILVIVVAIQLMTTLVNRMHCLQTADTAANQNNRQSSTKFLPNNLP